MKNILTESKINRILAWNKIHDCSMITAFRQYDKDGNPISRDVNNKKNIFLGKALRYHGYGITSVIGTYEEQIAGFKALQENSWFVVNLHDDSKFVNDIINFGIADGQDSVMIIPKNGFFDVNTVYLYGTNDNCMTDDDFIKYKEKKFATDIKFNDENDMLTKIKNKNFWFKFDNIIEEDSPVFDNFSNAQNCIGTMKKLYKFMFEDDKKK